MNCIELIILSLALAMDSFAVSLASGTIIKRNKLVLQALIMSIAFGLSHAAAIIIGWFAGDKFIAQISNFDHWIAFGLLTIIGIKMIWESFSRNEKSHPCPIKQLPLLCVATSIDAVAVGLSLALLHEPMIRVTITIGGIVFLLSLLGVIAGRKLQKYLGNFAELMGGLILILIGIKIILEHL